MVRQKPVMDRRERFAGRIFFVVYLLVLPLAADPLFDGAERLLHTGFSPAVRNVIYYYGLFAAAVLLFHRFLGRTSRVFRRNVKASLKTALLGLVALYGLNELVYRVFHPLFDRRANLNDTAIFDQIADAPHVTFLIVIFLAPFVEEVLFRGLVFGNLRVYGRPAAYAASCLLFALLHVWQFAVMERDVTYFLLMVQYLAPGLVLALTYDRTGTIWTPILLHAGANALNVWSLF